MIMRLCYDETAKAIDWVTYCAHSPYSLMWIYDLNSHCATTLLFDRSSWSLQFYWATIVHSSSCTHDDANHISEWQPNGLARALHNRPLTLKNMLREARHLGGSMLSTTDTLPFLWFTISQRLYDFKSEMLSCCNCVLQHITKSQYIAPATHMLWHLHDS
jgi:hypothetical protein